MNAWEASPDGREWLPARVPGTAAAVLRDAGRAWGDLDAEEWIWRTRFDAAEGETVLRCDGIATVADVTLNGETVLESESMFERHEVDVAAVLRERGNELVIRCRPLAPLLAQPRKPRARWRTRLVDGNLRWYRTMLLGRAPGFAPGPAPVGPWRPVSLERPRTRVGVRTRIEGNDGVVEFSDGRPPQRIPDVERWWPHTHGEPRLYDVDGVRVGFRELEATDPLEGLALRVNGTEIFARGAVWTPVDFVSLAPSHEDLRRALERVRDAGMNMLRVVGTSAYESDAFHDLCDELGILVWQDFMFANLDYPIADDGFRATVEREVRQVLRDLAWRPSTAVLCGNSEIEQQVAMLGLDPALGRGELFGELLPRLVRESQADAVYVPSAPSGGELPFRPDSGVAHYFGVGGYRRPLDDARRANVRFAAECLALANVPNAEVTREEGVTKDAGTDWDFADVRDHYLRELHGAGPEDPDYLELSRAVSGEVMGEVFGEWRRAGSSCAGGLVLWLRDLAPGSGWGLEDCRGEPKVAWHHLRRLFAPVAVWTTDEGTNGIDVHVANDRPELLRARLRATFYRDLELAVDEGGEELDLPPRTTVVRNVEGILGRFVDASYAYRFGPPGHDAVVVALERDGETLSQAVRFPLGYPHASALGLEASRDGGELVLRTRRLAYGVRVHVDGFRPDDDSFFLEPGRERRLAVPAGGRVTALNLAGEVAFS